MTLGEKIAALRSAHKLSQGDLAEKLNVSRQSISKWEPNASIPELDKLLQLSSLFHITLDDLVRSDEIGKKSAESEPAEKDESAFRQAAPPVQIIVQKSIGIQKIVGFLLLAMGLFCCILALALGGGLLIIGGYIIFCSTILLSVKKYAALIIGWITLTQALFLTPYFTGIRMFAAFNPGYYQGGISLSQLISLIMWLFLFVLLFFTIRIWRKRN